MGEKLKVLMLNGSPRGNGNIALAFKEMEKIFAENDVEFENILLGKTDIRGCIACETCRKNKKCVFDDIVNELAVKFEQADGLVIGSPVYYGSVNGTLLSALQRLFYSTSFDKSFKVGASVVSARRSGCTATFDILNKFFTLSNMPVATSQYWNNIYGWEAGEGDVDDEGKQVMRVLARNMVFLMKSIAAGKKEIGLPDKEERVWTNFTRDGVFAAKKAEEEKADAVKAADSEEKTAPGAEAAKAEIPGYPANLAEGAVKPPAEPVMMAVYAGPENPGQFVMPDDNKPDDAQFMMVYAGPGWKPSDNDVSGIGAQMVKTMMEAGEQPSDSEWTCSCGMTNKGRFCTECGAPRAAGRPAGTGTVLV
ncbi:MAG: flavodoxin family protein [Lachnospiraceae bacterium]|nr:flavodoxin family protein [Lachnospiraceae bacterium]